GERGRRLLVVGARRLELERARVHVLPEHGQPDLFRRERRRLVLQLLLAGGEGLDLRVELLRGCSALGAQGVELRRARVELARDPGEPRLLAGDRLARGGELGRRGLDALLTAAKLGEPLLELALGGLEAGGPLRGIVGRVAGRAERLELALALV